MVTTVGIYNDVSRELNKFNSPTYTLGTFNYFLNKSIVDFITKSYDKYAIDQKITDDLRLNSSSETIDLTAKSRYISTPFKLSAVSAVISTQGKLTSFEIEGDEIKQYLGIGSTIMFDNDSNNIKAIITNLNGNTVKVTPDDAYNFVNPFPNTIKIVDTAFKFESINGKQIVSFTPSAFNYMHMLMAKITMKYSITADGCNTLPKIVYKELGVKRSTYDMQSATSWNSYLMPSIKSPYYYVYSNKTFDDIVLQSDGNYLLGNLPVIKLFLGKEVSNISPISIDLVWLNNPKIYNLTNSQLYAGESPEVIKIPDYVSDDIVKSITMWIMGNEGNPLIGTFVQTNAEAQQPQVNKK